VEEIGAYPKTNSFILSKRVDPEDDSKMNK
jgi:hypothetical protein